MGELTAEPLKRPLPHSQELEKAILGAILAGHIEASRLRGSGRDWQSVHSRESHPDEK